MHLILQVALATYLWGVKFHPEILQICKNIVDGFF